jgi:enoyl-CoA hydratase/carnithine racemase
VRFRADARGIVFDDGGMNLLSSDALKELREVIASVWVRASARTRRAEARRHTEAATSLGMTVFTFRFARSAGADMNEMLQFSPRDAEEFSRAGQEVFAAIERLPMLTVAIIDGDCFGGALDLVMAFDLRFATPRARFAHPGARIGIVTGFGGTSRWRKIAGRPAANALMIGNRTLSAEEARDLGFVDRVAEDHEEELRRLESLDPATTRYVKELTLHADKLTRSQLLLLATRLGNLYFR